MFKTRTTAFAALSLAAALFCAPTFAAANDPYETFEPDADTNTHYSCHVGPEQVASYMLDAYEAANATPEQHQRYCSIAETGSPEFAGNYFINDIEWLPVPQQCGQRHFDRYLVTPFIDQQGQERTLVEAHACRVDTYVAQSPSDGELYCQAIMPSQSCMQVEVRVEGPGYGADLPTYGGFGGVPGYEGADDGGGSGGCTSDADCAPDEHCHENQGPNGTCAKNGT